MLTDDEMHAVVNHLTDRHTWYMENLTDPELRFQALCAEVGISQAAIIELIDFIVTSHTNRSPAEVLHNEPFVAHAICHGIWSGIEIGKQVAKVVMGDNPSEAG
jgi:hypothetical protein